MWLWYGDSGLPADERPPIPSTPELEAPGWRAVYGELEFDAPHWPVRAARLMPARARVSLCGGVWGVGGV